MIKNKGIKNSKLMLKWVKFQAKTKIDFQLFYPIYLYVLLPHVVLQLYNKFKLRFIQGDNNEKQISKIQQKRNTPIIENQLIAPFEQFTNNGLRNGTIFEIK